MELVQAGEAGADQQDVERLVDRVVQAQARIGLSGDGCMIVLPLSL
ncbi:MAG: hypothetical protein QM674_20880 [Burkholderiaceae bacterium]